MNVQLSSRQRWELAILMYQCKPEGDALTWTKRFNRSRLALGLTPIMDVLTGKPFDPSKINDELKTFDITDDYRDFLLASVLVNIKTPQQAMALGNLIEALETHKQTGKAPDAPDAPAYEKEDWALPTNAIDDCVKNVVETSKMLKVEDKELFAKLEQALTVANAQNTP